PPLITDCAAFFYSYPDTLYLPSFPTRRSSDLGRYAFDLFQHVGERILGLLMALGRGLERGLRAGKLGFDVRDLRRAGRHIEVGRSEEHTSELQSRENLVCRLLLEKKK